MTIGEPFPLPIPDPPTLPPLAPYRQPGSTDCTRAFVESPDARALILRRGAIAYCSRGMLGLITCDCPQPVDYGNGQNGVAWVGIHLTGQIGAPWSSREPEVVGHISQLLPPRRDPRWRFR